LITLLTFTAVPAVAFAQRSTDFASLVQRITTSILNPALILLMGIAVVLFLWGVVKYIQSGDKAEQRTESIRFMVWGVIALFVMVSVYGLITVIERTFNLDNSTIPTPPQFGGSSSEFSVSDFSGE